MADSSVSLQPQPSVRFSFLTTITPSNPSNIMAKQDWYKITLFSPHPNGPNKSITFKVWDTYGIPLQNVSLVVNNKLMFLLDCNDRVDITISSQDELEAYISTVLLLNHFQFKVQYLLPTYIYSENGPPTLSVDPPTAVQEVEPDTLPATSAALGVEAPVVLEGARHANTILISGI
ncbi:hypothetical protein M422DRAFT_46201 [Sphaerobolus stellatus SS14]|nr:hypothetical protein M422DRAFT_46201 [Sphaerobolus stellatus SS14]